MFTLLKDFYCYECYLFNVKCKIHPYNLSIRYLKAYADQNLYTTSRIYDKRPNYEHRRRPYSKKPDVIGFSCYIWNIEETIKVIEMLKKIIQILSILGGPEVTYDVEEWLDRINGVILS